MGFFPYTFFHTLAFLHEDLANQETGEPVSLNMLKCLTFNYVIIHHWTVWTDIMQHYNLIGSFVLFSFGVLRHLNTVQVIS